VNKSKKVSIGVVGLHGQAARIVEVIQKISDIEAIVIYYPGGKDTSDSRVTSSFSELENCSAVIIASPTSTHAEYLGKLRNFSGYILCEKPMVITPEEAKAIELWPSEKIKRLRVNYNFLHSPVAQTLIGLIKKSELGKPLSLSIHSSHGLAFKQDYEGGWRAHSARYGVVELVGVHFINFALMSLGPLKHSTIATRNVSGRGRVSDTAFIDLTMQNDCRVQICVSYAMPYSFGINFFGSNGHYKYDGHTEVIRSPRDTFDTRGRYCDPPIVQQRRIDHAESFSLGLENALKQFLRHVIYNRPFNPHDLRIALDTMSPLFECGDGSDPIISKASFPSTPN
jgi:predicted dehydrogenase